MPNALLSKNPAHARNNIMGCPTRGLIDYNEPVHRVEAKRALQRCPNDAKGGVHIKVASEPSREPVAAATICLSDSANICSADRSQAYLDRAVDLLLQDAGNLSLSRSTHNVDEALCFVESAVVTGEHVLR